MRILAPGIQQPLVEGEGSVVLAGITPAARRVHKDLFAVLGILQCQRLQFLGLYDGSPLGGGVS